MGGRGSGSNMGGGGAVVTAKDGSPITRRQISNDTYDELQNHAYPPRAVEFATAMVIDGENPLNHEMTQRYGYNTYPIGGRTEGITSAQREGAQKWINDHPDKVNTAIKNSEYNPTATKMSQASPFSKSPESAPVGTVLRMGDWRYTKNKSGSWTTSKSGKRQPNRTNNDIKWVFS